MINNNYTLRSIEENTDVAMLLEKASDILTEAIDKISYLSDRELNKECIDEIQNIIDGIDNVQAQIENGSVELYKPRN